jgi:hypothetical protein
MLEISATSASAILVIPIRQWMAAMSQQDCAIGSAHRRIFSSSSLAEGNSLRERIASVARCRNKSSGFSHKISKNFSGSRKRDGKKESEYSTA